MCELPPTRASGVSFANFISRQLYSVVLLWFSHPVLQFQNRPHRAHRNSDSRSWSRTDSVWNRARGYLRKYLLRNEYRQRTFKEKQTRALRHWARVTITSTESIETEEAPMKRTTHIGQSGTCGIFLIIKKAQTWSLLHPNMCDTV